MILEHRTPLMVASTYGSLAVIRLLLSLRSVDFNRHCGPDTAIALHCAASGGAQSAVRLLLAANVDADAKDGAGEWQQLERRGRCCRGQGGQQFLGESMLGVIVNDCKGVFGVARGTAFLHTELAGNEVPHGNLKSANVLLAPDFEPLLVDFGFSGLISHMQSPQSMFAHRAPECVAGHPVSAKADVYCLGIVLLELLTGKFPAQYLHNAKGGTDLVMWSTLAIADGFERDLFDPAIVTAWKFALPDMAWLAVEFVEMDLERRPDMKEVAARVEEVVSASLATVRERQAAAGGEGSARLGDAASRSSHATYVRDGSIQQITSVGERSYAARQQ